MSRNNPFTTYLALLLGVCLLCQVLIAQAASITASVDRNPVSIDESFNLRLKARGELDGKPDLSVLQQQFDILGTSQSTSISNVNGQFSREAVWNITLISKQTGSLIIPSIAFGQDISPAISITVVDGNTPQQSGQPRTLYLEAETDVSSTWVQGQLVYINRLFSHTPVIGDLFPPETSDTDAIIERLGEDSVYEAFREGVRYDVIERRYAIYPSRSGKLRIETARFEGRSGQSRSIFDNMRNSGTVRRSRAEAVEVEVLPVPATADATAWLPARNVSLQEEWSVAMDQLEAGEPVTRTITLHGSGVHSSLLPEIIIDDIDGIKQYPDQSQLGTEVSKRGIDASRQIKVAMIPAAGGIYQLPAIEIPWWNTDSGQLETAVLPARSITVQGAAAPVPTPQQASTDTSTAEREDARIPAVATPQTTATSDTDGFWRWLSLALFVLWILTLGWLLSSRTKTSRRTPSLKKLRQQLIDTCRGGDARACKDAMLAWGRARWSGQRISNLMDLLPLVERPLADALRELNSTLYSDHADHWDGTRLAELIETLPLNVITDREPEDLVAPLYRH